MSAIDMYTCPDCGLTFEYFRLRIARDPKRVVKCECGGKAEYDFGATVKPTRPRDRETVFEPYWEEHLAAQPVFIDSPRTLERECKKRGLELVKPHKRAPSYCRQGSQINAPTRQQAMAWLDDN